MISSARSRSFCSSMQTAARRISSISRSKRVIIERSRSTRCLAASSPSESFKEQKHRNRMSKQERRELLEAFVDRYRALNAGKFPTVSHAKNEVGGSFYVVREILQELEYNHKMSPRKPEKPTEFGAKTDVTADTCESPDIKEGGEVPLLSTDSEKSFMEESARHSTIETIHPSEQIVEGIENSGTSEQISSDDHIDIKDPEKDAPSRLVNKSGKDNVSDPIKSQVIDIEAPQSSPLRLANENRKDSSHDPTQFQADASVPLKLETEEDILNTQVHHTQGTIGDKSSTIGVDKVIEQRSNEEVSKSDKRTSDNSRTSEQDASSPKGSSIWGNLRSLADGIINFWRQK